MELNDLASLPANLRNATAILTFAAGQRLFRQGDPAGYAERNRANNFYIVTSGRIKLVRYTIEGRMVVLQVVRSGESLGENTIIADAYTCTAIAEVESNAVVYPKPLLAAYLRDYPELAEDLTTKLISKIQSLEVGLELLQIRSAHLRLLQYLQYNAAFSNTVNLDRPLKEVAAELNLAPRTLSRALTRLEYEGRITRQDNSIDLQTL